MLALAVILSLPGVTVDVRSAPPCFNAAELEAALHDKHGPGRVLVELSSSGLNISLERPGYARLARVMAFTLEDCVELTHTVTLLVLSWWDVSAPLPRAEQAPSSHRAEPEPARATIEGPPNRTPGDSEKSQPPRPSAEAAPLPSAPISQTAAPAATAASSASAPSAPVAGQAEADPPELPPLSAASVPEVKLAEPARSSPMPPRPWLISAALLGHASFDGTLSAAGRLAVEAGLENGIGATLDAGIETARSAVPTANVQVSAWLGFASLVGRYRVAFDRVALELGLGLRLFRIEASGHGDLVNAHSAATYVPAGLLAADLSVRLGAGFFLIASLQGFLRFWSQQVEILGLPTVMTLPSAGITAGLGVGYRLK